MRCLSLPGVFVSVLTLLAAQPTAARTSLWQRVVQPLAARADAQLLLAEQARMLSRVAAPLLALPASNAQQLTERLNELTVGVAALAIANNRQQRGDPRLLFLLADALLKTENPPLARIADVLRAAVKQDPESPLAAQAWVQLAATEGKLGNRHRETSAYTQSLQEEWRSAPRATIFLNRGESAMATQALGEAQRDYKAALQLAENLTTRTLARWGLAVATDRLGDLPTALTEAQRASSHRFGSNSQAIVALDLPGTYFLPPYEIHYYRALATMGEAQAASSPADARRLWLTAQFLWGLYLGPARQEGAAWVERAAHHLQHCKTRALTKLD